jgi:response regulator RpfG family c-di-GMP phosphodiesterase
MAVTTVADTVVLVDDELHNMVWMMDYLDHKGLLILPAGNANEAIDIIDEEIYRCAIIDLNIPISAPLVEAAAKKGAVYAQYPGLFVAWYARNRGYRNRQVVLYSVHREQSVAQEAERLRCTYILKGRPKEIKEELEAVVSFDPTTK